MQPVKLGMIGCGTVGTGVARLLIEKQQMIQERTGIPLVLKYVADLDHTTDRGITFEPGVFIDDAMTIIDDPEVDIVVEMIGGLTAAKDLINAAIARGKHVVTANKALLASDGNAIFKAAAAAGVDLAYEASVAGCIPIIKSLREALVGNEIQSLVGILNGTCNYILTKITEEGIPFDQALAQAQANGYAEADPTLDIEGFDAAHKLAIVTALAYGMEIKYDDIYVEGISTITPLDIEYAREFGYRIKLLAISKNRGDQVEARVHPAMIPMDNILSNVSGSLNAITVNGHAVEDLFLSGYGAGMMPTASAVVERYRRSGPQPPLRKRRPRAIDGLPGGPGQIPAGHAGERYRHPLLFPVCRGGPAGRSGQNRRHPRGEEHQHQIGAAEGPQGQRPCTHRHHHPSRPGSRCAGGARADRQYGCRGSGTGDDSDRRREGGFRGEARLTSDRATAPTKRNATSTDSEKKPCTSFVPTWKVSWYRRYGSMSPARPESRN